MGSPSRCGIFGVLEFLPAMTVAVLLDQAARRGEVVLRAARAAVEVGGPGLGVVGVEQAGAVQVDVGQEQRHRTALGDFPGFVEVGTKHLLRAEHEEAQRHRDAAAALQRVH